MHLNPQPLDNKANVQVSNSAMRMQLLLKLLWHIALKWVRSNIAFVSGQGFESPPQQSLVAEQKRVKLLKSKILKKNFFWCFGGFLFSPFFVGHHFLALFAKQTFFLCLKDFFSIHVRVLSQFLGLADGSTARRSELAMVKVVGSLTRAKTYQYGWIELEI